MTISSRSKRGPTTKLKNRPMEQDDAELTRTIAGSENTCNCGDKSKTCNHSNLVNTTQKFAHVYFQELLPTSVCIDLLCDVSL